MTAYNSAYYLPAVCIYIYIYIYHTSVWYTLSLERVRIASMGNGSAKYLIILPAQWSCWRGILISLSQSVHLSICSHENHSCGLFSVQLVIIWLFRIMWLTTKMMSNDFMKCLYMPCVFWFRRENTHTHHGHLCAQVSMYGLKQKNHKSYGHLFPSLHVWTVCSYKTPLLWLVFDTVGHFVVILFMCSHTKPIATQEKRHTNLLTKVATRHHFVGLDIRTQPHKTW